jgi:hypothetical protein
MHDVRTMALKLLDGMAVEHQGVSLTFEWAPSSRKLTVYVRPEYDAVASIAQAAKVGPSGVIQGPPSGS